MAKNVNDIIKRLSSARQKKVDARAAQLIANEMTLQEVLKARKKGGSEKLTPGGGETR